MHQSPQTTREASKYLCFQDGILFIKFPANSNLDEEVFRELAVVSLQRTPDEKPVKVKRWSVKDVHTFLKFEHLSNEELKELEISGDLLQDLPNEVIDILDYSSRLKMRQTIEKIKTAQQVTSSFKQIKPFISFLQTVTIQTPIKVIKKQKNDQPVKLVCNVTNQKYFTIWIPLPASAMRSDKLFQMRCAIAVDDPDKHEVFLMNEKNRVKLTDSVPTPFKQEQKYAIYNIFNGEKTFLFEALIHFQKDE